MQCNATAKLALLHAQLFSMLNPKSSLQEETSLRLMRILEKQPDITQRELAEQLGISVGGINYCLRALTGKGLVKMINFANSKNKFGYIYVLTPTGLAEKASLTRSFLKRKMQEYDALKVEIETLQSEMYPALDRKHF
jgi:EPS-associated MarR family transcriptional regulator